MAAEGECRAGATRLLVRGAPMSQHRQRRGSLNLVCLPWVLLAIAVPACSSTPSSSSCDPACGDGEAPLEAATDASGASQPESSFENDGNRDAQGPIDATSQSKADAPDDEAPQGEGAAPADAVVPIDAATSADAAVPIDANAPADAMTALDATGLVDGTTSLEGGEPVAESGPLDGAAPLDAAEASTAWAPLCTATPCPAGQTMCSGICVSNSDPAYSCGTCLAGGCALPHAEPACTAGQCTIATCQPGWVDNDGLASNGCETSLASPTTCTSAQLSCSGATSLCSPTGCVSTCTPPLTECSGSCVDLTASPDFCGSCTFSCYPEGPGDRLYGGFPTCTVSGTCGALSCFPGFTSCSGSCVNTQTDSNNCGVCGNQCPSVGGAVTTCVGGTCAALCPLGWTDCNSTCVVTQTDQQNCGACGAACPTGQLCVQSACVDSAAVWLVTGLSAPGAIATDVEAIYWADTGNGTVNAISKSGGAILPLASSQAKPVSVAVDDSYVYWSNNLGGAVWRTLKSGGDTAHLVAAVTTPTSVVVDSTYVYVIDGNGAIERALKEGGGTPTIFASGFIYDSIGIDGASLYGLAEAENGSIGILNEVDTATGVATPVSQLEEFDSSGVLTVGGDFVASTQGGIGTQYIQWLNVSSGQSGRVFPMLNSASLEISGIGVAPCGFVMTTEVRTFTGLVVAPFEAPVVPLLATAALPSQFVVDGLYVYWTDPSGAIGKLALP
jgi:hypothetical protein